MNADDKNAWFEAAFESCWPRLYAVLLRLVDDPAEAQDLALEAFWRLHQHPPPDRSLAVVSGWLYRTGTHLGLNVLRARRRRQRYESQAAELQSENSDLAEPSAAVEKVQERALVRQVLAAMQPRAAQALLLRHSGLSYAEVAAALGITPGSVGTVLARAEAEFEQRYRRTVK